MNRLDRLLEIGVHVARLRTASKARDVSRLAKASAFIALAMLLGLASFIVLLWSMYAGLILVVHHAAALAIVGTLLAVTSVVMALGASRVGRRP